MLVQSHSGYIEFLPAVPDAWKIGLFEGLKVRGGGDVSAKWEHGMLTRITLKATVPNKFVVLIPEMWDTDKLSRIKSKDIEIIGNKLYITMQANQELVLEP